MRSLSFQINIEVAHTGRSDRVPDVHFNFFTCPGPATCTSLALFDRLLLLEYNLHVYMYGPGRPVCAVWQGRWQAAVPSSGSRHRLIHLDLGAKGNFDPCMKYRLFVKDYEQTYPKEKLKKHEEIVVSLFLQIHRHAEMDL